MIFSHNPLYSPTLPPLIKTPYTIPLILTLLLIGNGTGCPGVFLGNPCPYPSEPVPVHKGRVLLRTGHGLGITHGFQKPIWDRNAGSQVYHKEGYLMYTR